MLDCTPCARNCSEYFVASPENYRRGVAVLKSYTRKLSLRNVRVGCQSNAVRRAGICARECLRQGWMPFKEGFN